jgi:hypothetical protein
MPMMISIFLNRSTVEPHRIEQGNAVGRRNQNRQKMQSERNGCGTTTIQAKRCAELGCTDLMAVHQ